MAEEGQEKPVEAAPTEPVVPEEKLETPPAEDEKKPDTIKPVEDAKSTDSSDMFPGKTKPRGRRWIWWTVGTIGVLAILGVLTWRLKWYMPVFNRVYAASVTFKVREDETYVLQGATLTFRGTTYTTDASGQVIVPQTVAGDWSVLVSKDGYTPYDGGVVLKKGDNGTVSISLKKEPDKLYAFKGLVEDYVSGGALVGAQVALAGQTAVSDAAGGFSFEKLAAGDFALTVSKTGFTTNEQTVTITATNAADVTAGAPSKVTLVPSGNVLFVSNRDGKRALYTAGYDGKNQQQLVTPVAGTEDFGPIQSPDGKYVVFSSTRDKVADTYNTGYLSRLYIVGSDGKNLKKISDDVSPAKVVWGESSKYIYFEAYQDAKLTTYTRRFYDLAKGSTFDLGEESVDLAINHAGVQSVYAVSNTAADNSVTYDLKIVDMTTGNRRTLVTGITDFLSNSLSLSADDTLVYYETQGTDGRKRFQTDWVSGTVTGIALSTEPARTYTMSPDNKWKAFIDTRDGQQDLFLVDAQGQNELRLTTMGVVSSSARVTWDATSQYLTFGIVREGESAIYVVSAAGGQVQKIVDFTPDSQPIPYY